MSISVNLKVNSSPVEKIGKTLSAGNTYSCSLKEDTSILNPVLILYTTDNIYTFNYMYISDFSRYYFITDIISIGQNRWEIHAHVDVLETYATAIKANSAVIKRQQHLFNLYLDDPEYKTYNYERIQTLKFKGGTGGFTKNLKYVLTVNGSYEAQNGGDNNG